MATGKLEKKLDARTCANCGKAADELSLEQVEYRCPACGFEMAHLDLATNGSIRGIFGYLKSVGEIIQDRYKVERVLGRGGFGATYLVEDLRIEGKHRALKEVPALLFDRHEVALLSRLRNRAIPDVTDRFESEGMVYLVLAFGGTHTLRSRCMTLGGRVPLSTALPWMRQCCDALGYLHSQNPPVIHRDIKPENILLDDSNCIMLIDFGIAKATAPASTTRVSARAFSLGFSPPEQVIGTGTDERSDIYSFGATFYYLLTGQVPPAAHERMMGKEIRPPSEITPGLPPFLDEFLLSTLNMNAGQRPESIERMKVLLACLENIVSAESPHMQRTLRFDAGIPHMLSESSGASLQGIRIAPDEAPSAEASGSHGNRKERSSVILVAFLTGMIAFSATGAYFLLNWRKTAPMEETASDSDSQSRGHKSAPTPASVQPVNTLPTLTSPESIAQQSASQPSSHLVSTPSEDSRGGPSGEPQAKHEASPALPQTEGQAPPGSAGTEPSIKSDQSILQSIAPHADILQAPGQPSSPPAPAATSTSIVVRPPSGTPEAALASPEPEQVRPPSHAVVQQPVESGTADSKESGLRQPGESSFPPAPPGNSATDILQEKRGSEGTKPNESASVTKSTRNEKQGPKTGSSKKQSAKSVPPRENAPGQFRILKEEFSTAGEAGKTMTQGAKPRRRPATTPKILKEELR